MEPSRRGDPERIGPYAVLGRLDASTVGAPTGGSPAVGAPTGAVTAAAHRFVARSRGGDRTVILTTPPQGTDPDRFRAEAEAARRLFGPWTAVVDEVGATGVASEGTTGGDNVPWYTTPYLPALPLPTALAAHGGPLPERTVRALGTALAEALAALHATGAVHAGVSPAAVLLTSDGPRLTGYGAVRAAAPAGPGGTGPVGPAPGTVSPEQLAGARPEPPGDVFALGAVLAYAATGHTVPERDELPEGLRALVSACLARDPAHRPSVRRLLDELPGTAPGFGPPPDMTGPPRATVLDGGPSRAAALLGPGWLPARAVAALVRQSAAVLAAEPPPPAVSPHSAPSPRPSLSPHPYPSLDSGPS
ncbi:MULTISPECIES: protein kinase family protein [Streptomyces]|uniref:serine/threonine protein kinase n=1 Tax=Streptomyces TaxID=1883 RepID=UPI00163BCC01|nr:MULTISPECIES: serine/threonine protein kinase [Streptomyces]MBC2879555.1 serine/threonine protein kinase [Streptomyces sp. TYQ1024]UBI36481.1 serine/threonine protein kinase [Streptomyces mobaraensis]UKW29072.1 serine/threonine protein kinase [Streptomyces sp. TYQ1024]